jgi:hypothetical protein
MDEENKYDKALRELASAQTQHLNRQLALEAFAHSLIQLLSPAQAAAALEGYEHGLDQIAGQVPPNMQRPKLWDDLKHDLEARSKLP